MTLTRPEDYVNHSLYFEAKTFLQRPAGRRGQAQHGAWRSRRACRSSTTISSTSPCGCRRDSSSAISTEVVRLNENEPGGKAAALFRANARRQADPAQDDGPVHSRRDRRSGEARLLGAGRELVQGREHRLRAPPALQRRRRASTIFSIATPCGRWSTITSRAAKTAGC